MAYGESNGHMTEEVTSRTQLEMLFSNG